MKSSKTRTSTTKKRSTKKSSNARRLTGGRRFLLPGIAALVVGAVGLWMLVSSFAATVGPVRVQTADGCWLAGRVWSSSTSSCTKNCRGAAGPYKIITGVSGTNRGYCVGALVPWTTIGETRCINTLHRKFVYDIGCSRRVDQDNTLNARQCQPDYPNYIADSGADHCVAPTTTTTTGGTTNTSSSDAVNNSYKSLWLSGANATSGWTGSVSGCHPGNISYSARVAQLNAVNFARQLAGLTPVVAVGLDSTAQANVQKAALMMDANNTLSHYPPKSWLCYTSAGASTASVSNLFYWNVSAIKPLDVISGYLNDNGTNNTAVGHRRWLLRPEAAKFAFGMTAQAAATQVTGLTENTGNNNPSWVGWPTKGYFPSPLEPNGRWSLSAGNKNMRFGKATITVKYNGTVIPVTKYAPDNAYARPTVVWQMPSTMSKTGTYTVTVSNITNTNTTSTYTASYSVTLFSPY